MGKAPPLQLLHLKIISKFANDFSKIGLYPLYRRGDATLVIRGKNSKSQTPSNEVLKDWQAANEVKLVIDDQGNPKILLVSAPAEHEIAFIDWISFSS